MPESPSARLLHRIHEECGLAIPDGTEIHRTYAGRLQRQEGAWSWFALDPHGFEVCGSHYPVTTLLRAKGIVASIDTHEDAVGYAMKAISIDPVEVSRS